MKKTVLESKIGNIEDALAASPELSTYVKIQEVRAMLNQSHGACQIFEERIEQITKHGYSVIHDCYKNEELIRAAAFCMNIPGCKWPWVGGNSDKSRVKIINKNWIERLRVAGAFIAAEIDRLEALERLNSIDAKDKQFKEDCEVYNDYKKTCDFQGVHPMSFQEYFGYWVEAHIFDNNVKLTYHGQRFDRNAIVEILGGGNK